MAVVTATADEAAAAFNAVFLALASAFFAAFLDALALDNRSNMNQQ